MKKNPDGFFNFSDETNKGGFEQVGRTDGSASANSDSFYLGKRGQQKKGFFEGVGGGKRFTTGEDNFGDFWVFKKIFFDSEKVGFV